jgi:hypothetical protein
MLESPRQGLSRARWAHPRRCFQTIGSTVEDLYLVTPRAVEGAVEAPFVLFGAQHPPEQAGAAEGVGGIGGMDYAVGAAD